MVLVFLRIEYWCPGSTFRLLYLFGPGTLSGSSAIYPFDGIFYINRAGTSRESEMENPRLVFRLSSKIVFKSYLEEPGEQVRSLVKSDLLP